MSTFNKEDLISLEKLSRIRLSPDKEDSLTNNIQKILDYIDMLDEVDTEGVIPLTHVIKDMVAPLAEDEVHDKLSSETFLKNSPDKVGAFLKVPVVIETGEEI